MIIVVVVVLLILALGLAESFFHDRCLRSIPVRILVNGTRGKTSTARLIVSALNLSGIPAMGRTTGSEACIINSDGSIEPFVRRHGARITEAIGFARLCSSRNAKAMVVECMALGEENQKVFSQNLIKPGYVVITNSYIDHVPEIGSTREQTIWTLSRSINPGSEVYAIDREYEAYCKAAGANFHLVSVHDYESMELKSHIPVHDANISLAVELGKALGIGEPVMLEALKLALPDIGLDNSFITRSGAIFIPDFAINDYECMREAIIKASGEKKLCVIYNNRSDREFRLLLARRIFLELGNGIDCVYAIGDYPEKCARYFRHSNVKSSAISVQDLASLIESAGEDYVFLAIGNIKGSGQLLLQSLGGK
ncbi:MAG: Mur ligase family protein [Sphaerochaetaceae bacterium]|jgi:poly-gamma-glutamate synthase PgsB/CapB|nr:Mur ligase family protein [Sphaerochaetaceae bacterium]